MNARTLVVLRHCRRRLAWLTLSGLAGLAGCGSLLPQPPASPALYVFDDEAAKSRPALVTPPLTGAEWTLVVDEPRSAAGYGTRQIIYVRTSSQLEAFAFSQWAEPPAQMLAPLLVQAIARTGVFAAVVRAPSSAAADVRLETELVRLQQDFSVKPSRVHMTLHAVLVDTATRRVLASGDFEELATSASNDPAGGVAAANAAAHHLSADIAAFCAKAVASRR